MVDELQRTFRDLKDVDKVGINLETSLAAIALAPLPVNSVVMVLRASMVTLNSPSKAGSRNPPPPLSPLLVQLYTVSKMTAYGEMGDDAMSKKGRRASLAGVLTGGVGFVSCVLLCASLLILPLSPTSPSKADSRSPPPPLSPLLVQRASLAGVLAGGVGFVSCVLLCASLLTLPLSLTSPSKAGSRSPHPPLSPFLIQLCTVSKMTAYGELGDDAMGKQGRRTSLAGVLAGGVSLSPTSPSKADSRNPPPPLSPLLVQLCTVSTMIAYGELGDNAMGEQGRRASLAGVLVGGGGRGGRGGGDGVEVKGEWLTVEGVSLMVVA